ncbi:MAG: 5-formyltetrahydrofolate cyclo-ligase [Parvibaculum sp.]|nr:5-formyltetrahydrofolate cyclo-ligase [Parvibaculum sp.]
MSAEQAKKEARLLAKSRRAVAFEKFEGLGGGLFVQPFIQSIPIAPSAVVAAYVAKGDEADPSVLTDILSGHGCKIVLPRVVGPDQPLTFCAWKRGDQLVPGPFGILEPKASAPELVPDIVIVPLLAYGAQGQRLGYGGGYYDRTLALLRARNPAILVIGLAFAAQEVTHLAIESNDQALDWIVTERGATDFRKS